MEDYEKKYKEALNWMEGVYPTLEGAAKEDAEHYFPELKESEDERIRKTLVKFFTDWGKTKSHCWSVPVDKIIAWLDKQSIKGTKGNDEEVPNSAWSEEDKEMMQVAINACCSYQDSLVRNDSRFDKAVEAEDWLKSLKERVRPKQEWSEEDKKALKVVTDVFGQYGVHLLSYPAYVHWLKTLPNRITFNPYWKPSKRQMQSIMNCALNKSIDADTRLVLDALYQDLLKLKT